MTLGTAANSKTVAMRLAAITCAAEQVNLYEFRPVSGDPVSRFNAGAHVDLHLPNGLVRQYSIMNGEGGGRSLQARRQARGGGPRRLTFHA